MLPTQISEEPIRLYTLGYGLSLAASGPDLRTLLKSRWKVPNVDHVPIAIFCAIIRKPIERVPLILDTGGTAIVMSIVPPVVVRYEGNGRRPSVEAI